MTKNKWVPWLTGLLLTALAVLYVCSFNDVAPGEFPGVYIANSSTYRDTLIIYNNGSYYHANQSSADPYTRRTGRWRPTIEGHYELDGSMDILPLRHRLTKRIYIPISIDGKVAYVKAR